MSAAVDEADKRQGRLGSQATFGGRETCEQQRKLDILVGPQLGHEVVELKDEADFQASEVGEFGVVQGVKGVAFEVSLAGGGGVEGSENVEEGAFTASARAGDGDDFAGENL